MTESYTESYSEEIDGAGLKTFTAAQILDTSFMTKPPVIDGLLYSGTYLFVGAPKVGKSFFMTQLAYHVATGRDFFGRHVYSGEVLYLALEDTYKRLQSRFGRMFGVAVEPSIHFCVEAKTLSEGLLEQLHGFVNAHPSTRLIIIDTLQKIRETSNEPLYSYANDYKIISALKAFSDERGVCVVLVHHTRKMTSQDRFDQISGTNGLLGAADGAFMLYKEKRTDIKATLEVSGRDIEEQKLTLRKNLSTLVWEVEKIETELWKDPPDPLLDKLKAFADTLGGEMFKGSAAELASKLGVDIKPNVMTRRLNIAAERLFKEYDIVYASKRTRDGAIIYIKSL